MTTADVEIDPEAAGQPVERDTVWRLYSMTKPITSVAATVSLMTQLLPSSTHPLRSQPHQLVHQALA